MTKHHACPNDTCTDGHVACWNPGGPCPPRERETGCELCGPCNHCTAADTAPPREVREPLVADQLAIVPCTCQPGEPFGSCMGCEGMPPLTPEQLERAKVIMHGTGELPPVGILGETTLPTVDELIRPSRFEVGRCVFNDISEDVCTFCKRPPISCSC